MLSGRCKRLVPLIFFFSLLLVSFPFFTDNIVMADVSGDYWYIDFGDYPDGTTEIDETDYGITWATVRSNNESAHVLNEWWIVARNPGNGNFISNNWFNLTDPYTTSNLEIEFASTRSNLNRFNWNWSFFNGGTLLYYVLMCDDSTGNYNIDFHLYWNNGTLIKSTYPIGGNAYFSLITETNVTTNMVYVYIENSSGINNWFNVPGLLPIDSVYMTYEDVGSNRYSEAFIMDFRCTLGNITTTQFEIICDYDNVSNCIKWQSFLDFYVKCNYPTGIYYRVVNCTNDVIMDGLRYAPLLLHHVTGVPIWREEWEDCSYGLIRVMDLDDYIDNDYQFDSDMSTDYGFCVDSYVPEGYYLDSKYWYDRGEGVDLSWQAPLGHMVDIRITQFYNDNKVIWNMTFNGTGEIENIYDCIPAEKYWHSDEEIYTGFHMVYMYNATSGVKIPGVWTNFDITDDLALIWGIGNRVIEQYSEQYVSGAHTLGSNVYVSFILPDGDVHSTWVCPNGVEWQYVIQCDIAGEWDCILYVNGNWFDHRNFTVVGETSVWEPNDDFGEYSIYIGLMVSLVIGLFVGYVTLSGVAFASGFLGTVMILAIPGQPFTLFPPILLFLIGLMLIFVVLMLIFRS